MKLRLTNVLVRKLLLCLYLTIPIFTWIFSRILGVIGLARYGSDVVILMIMTIYVLLCLIERKVLVPDFWLLYVLLTAFFALTIVIHPEYEPWYTRDDFGVWEYVLRPDNGLFLFLFIRLVDNPKEIKDTFKFSAWLLYVLYLYQVMQAITRGYWVDRTMKGYELHVSYNLSLGYSALIFVLVFLFDALEEKKVIDLVGSMIGIFIIVVAGSRGPFLDIAIFLVIYVMLKVRESRKKMILTILIAAGTALLWNIVPYLIIGVSAVLEKYHLSSRMVTKILSGDILDNSGRSDIWSAAMEMIRKKPLGYGAMGSRHVITDIIYVGHPHNFFLELFIDFGVIVGSIIIIWLVLNTIRMFKMKDQDEWKGVFLIFFARACQLLLSATFWHSIGLWGVLAVGFCMSKAQKKRGIDNVRQ